MGEEKGQREGIKSEVKIELPSDKEKEKKDIEENDFMLSKKTKPCKRSYRRQELNADDTKQWWPFRPYIVCETHIKGPDSSDNS